MSYISLKAQKIIQGWQNLNNNLKITSIKHNKSIEPFENWKSLISHSDTEYSKFLLCPKMAGKIYF